MAKKKKNEDQPMDTVDYMEKFGDWVEKNSKIFVIAFSVFVLAVGAYWALSLYQNNQITTVAKEAGMITRRVELLEEAIENAKNPESDEFKSNLEKELTSIKTSAHDLVSKYPNQSSTDLALIKVSNFLDTQEKTTEALELLSKSQPSSKRMLSGVLLLLKSKLHHKSGDDTKSISTYEELLKEDQWKSLHAEALIQKALLSKKAGDLESAESDLEKAKTLNESGAFFEDAEKYLRLIKYEKSQGTKSTQEDTKDTGANG